MTELVLPEVDAYSACWLEACLVCGASGDTAKMLFCMDCGEVGRAEEHSLSDTPTRVQPASKPASLPAG